MLLRGASWRCSDLRHDANPSAGTADGGTVAVDPAAKSALACRNHIVTRMQSVVGSATPTRARMPYTMYFIVAAVPPLLELAPQLESTRHTTDAPTTLSGVETVMMSLQVCAGGPYTIQDEDASKISVRISTVEDWQNEGPNCQTRLVFIVALTNTKHTTWSTWLVTEQV